MTSRGIRNLLASSGPFLYAPVNNHPADQPDYQQAEKNQGANFAKLPRAVTYFEKLLEKIGVGISVPLKIERQDKVVEAP